MDIAQRLIDIEAEVGRLSPVQKILLGTDGSVTQLLEAITGRSIVVRTRLQEVVPADEAVAESLGIRAGDPVNHRIVELKTGGGEEVLIYATSYAPVGRLPEEFRDDLMRADIPIGRIIQEHHIEARREILGARVAPAPEVQRGVFSLCRNEPLLSRQYRIIHGGEPLIHIEEQFPYNKFLDQRRVVVETPSRIHIGLIDMNGSSGRVDGGIGIALNDPGVLIEAGRAPQVEVSGGDPAVQDRVRETAAGILAAIRAGGGVSVVVRSSYPSHAGLGSGSQIALATARAICELYGRDLPVRELARLAGRGGTSGIGTAAFESGGFIIDGGHRFGPGGEKSDFRPSSASRGVSPPPVIVRHDFPADWKILVAIPDLPKGACGERETDIFRLNCPVPAEEVRCCCHEVLMRMLPGIAGHDIGLFGSSINAIQGLGFKKVELGLQPPSVAGLLQAMRDAGAAGAGMSSFGPALYAIGDTGMRSIEGAALSFMREHGGGSTVLTSARNHGAAVRVC
ncbi:MAG TPA: beta-ribofuranosylaminobenzene 5'-phosphate synthase [Methanoregula sp.]|nr:beta-ribofuranosylaminobenzene 5'-phosphate synthase [Methanoregula sp.]